MMGGLHIEMATLKTLGKWLEHGGWTSALVQANITSASKAEAMLSASHVTRTRYASSGDSSSSIHATEECL